MNSLESLIHPENFTTPVPSQAHWSMHNLPDILYQLKPTAAFTKNRGRILKMPSPFPGEPPIRVFDILPDRISSNIEEWKVETWVRSDKRLQLDDILARMHPDLRPDRNTLQQRGGRFRAEFRLITWGKGNKKSAKLRAEVIKELQAKGIDPAWNTTRGLTPGLIDPNNPSAGRIPLPEPFLGRLAAREAKLLKHAASQAKAPRLQVNQPGQDPTAISKPVVNRVTASTFQQPPLPASEPIPTGPAIIQPENSFEQAALIAAEPSNSQPIPTAYTFDGITYWPTFLDFALPTSTAEISQPVTPTAPQLDLDGGIPANGHVAQNVVNEREINASFGYDFDINQEPPSLLEFDVPSNQTEHGFPTFQCTENIVSTGYDIVNENIYGNTVSESPAGQDMDEPTDQEGPHSQESANTESNANENSENTENRDNYDPAENDCNYGDSGYDDDGNSRDNDEDHNQGEPGDQSSSDDDSDNESIEDQVSSGDLSEFESDEGQDDSESSDPSYDTLEPGKDSSESEEDTLSADDASLFEDEQETQQASGKTQTAGKKRPRPLDEDSGKKKDGSVTESNAQAEPSSSSSPPNKKQKTEPKKGVCPMCGYICPMKDLPRHANKCIDWQSERNRKGRKPDNAMNLKDQQRQAERPKPTHSQTGGRTKDDTLAEKKGGKLEDPQDKGKQPEKPARRIPALKAGLAGKRLPGQLKDGQPEEMNGHTQASNKTARKRTLDEMQQPQIQPQQNVQPRSPSPEVQPEAQVEARPERVDPPQPQEIEPQDDDSFSCYDSSNYFSDTSEVDPVLKRARYLLALDTPIMWAELRAEKPPSPMPAIPMPAIPMPTETVRTPIETSYYTEDPMYLPPNPLALAFETVMAEALDFSLDTLTGSQDDESWFVDINDGEPDNILKSPEAQYLRELIEDHEQYESSNPVEEVFDF